MKVLIFDESPHVGDMIRKTVFKKIPDADITIFHMLEVISDTLQQNRFDIVVLDLDNLDGQLIHFIKTARAANPDVNIIMLTFFPCYRVTEKLNKLKINLIFDKVSELGLLIETINSSSERYLSQNKIQNFNNYSRADNG